MSYAGTIFGPLALLALGIKGNPTTIKISLKAALDLGAQLETALIENDSVSRRKKP